MKILFSPEYSGHVFIGLNVDILVFIFMRMMNALWPVIWLYRRRQAILVQTEWIPLKKIFWHYARISQKQRSFFQGFELTKKV